MTKEAQKSRGPRPGELIAERYRIEKVLSADPPRRRYFALESEGGRRLDIVELPTEAAVAWTTAMTIHHPGLPSLLATLSRQGGSFGVFERADGKTLAEIVGDGTRFEPVAAARATLWLVEAVARLRRGNIVHGAINPDCIVFRSADPESVLLTYRGMLDERSPYRPPERSADDPIDPNDDLWGLSATLFLLLTGRPPPVGGVYSEEEVRAAGVEDEVLRGIIAQGLAADPTRRSERLASLRHPLLHWLAQRAQRAQQSIPPLAPAQRKTAGLRALGLSKLSEDPDAPAIEVRSTSLSEPPPPEDPPSIEVRESSPPTIEIPSSRLESERPPAADERLSNGPTSIGALATSSTPAASPSMAPHTRRSQRPGGLKNPSIWLGLALGAGMTIALYALIDRARDATSAPAVDSVPPPAETLPSATAVDSAPAAPIEPSPVVSARRPPVTHRLASETTGACVARHMPDGSFKSPPKTEFLCSTHDPRKGDHLLRAALAESTRGAAPSGGVRMWNSLSWYGLAGYAALRSACCPDAPPLELPTPALKCDAIGPLLDEIGRVAAAGGDPSEDLEAFRAAVDCEIAHRRSTVYWQKDKPSGAEPTTLKGLLETIANPRPPK